MQDIYDRQNQVNNFSLVIGEYCIKDVEMGSEDRRRFINQMYVVFLNDILIVSFCIYKKYFIY